MKSIKYFLAASLLCIIIISSSWKTKESDKTIILQVVENVATPELLKQSSDIISGRLTTYGLDSFRVTINEDKSQIVVSINDKTEIPEIEMLLTARGNLAFYETYNNDEFAAIVKDNRLVKMLSKSESGLGCTGEDQLKMINECIRSYGTIEGCRLLWKPESEDKPACLYALKTDKNGKPLLERSDIDSITFSRESRIEVTFKPEAAVLFAEATAKNTGRVIAIAIDDKVSSAPRVMGAIKGGKCEVSGDFTDRGSCLFLALLVNDPLPLNFNLVK